MHELSIAQSLVETVIKERHDRRLGTVLNLTVRVGELTDVFPEALEFGFQVTIQGTELEGSTLTIERVPIEATCNACRRRNTVERYLFICPDCGSSDVQVEQGMELEIAFIEVDDTEAGETG